MIPDPTAKAATRLSPQTFHSENTNDEAAPSAAITQSGDESGNENRRRSVRKKKRVCDGSENVESSDVKPSPTSGSGRKKKRKHVEAVTLFEVVTMGKSAMQTVIDDWIGAYVIDRDRSLLDLISFFIQCCGCKGVVTAEMCLNKDDSDIMSKMVEQVDEETSLQYKRFLAFPWILTVTWPMDTDSVEYPLIESGPYGRWFHAEFCDFMSVLVAQFQHSVIFDGYLMEALISLLTELSDSCVRAFRHTCTLAALRLLSSLVGVALSLSVGIENSQKLSRVQRTKTMRQRGPAQVERMQKKIAELQDKRAEIENMMDAIFKGVFLKRYRDILPEIRSICADELGSWMKLYSSAFLNDSYLKYMGWMMYDKIPDVRLKCVLGLQGLYEDRLLLRKLDLFTSRFKDRLISMTLDKDNEVAIQAMKLLLLMSKMCDDVFTPEDYKQLFQVVYSSQRPVALLGGELLFSKRINIAASEAYEEGNEKEVNKKGMLAGLMALLHFYHESEVHKHVIYLVDSLWNCGGALLKDWPTITSILLQDPISQSAGLSQKEELVVVEILLASMRQVSEGPALAGRTGAKKVMSARERKVQTDDCTKLTEHFLMVLPKLLSKFSHRSEVLVSLMKIPQYFVHECPKAESTQKLSDLLAEMGAIIELHSDSAVLETVSRTYVSLCQEGTSWCSVAQAARDSLVRGWVERLTLLLEDSLQGDCFCADEEKTGAFIVTLKKLKAFQNGHELSQWNLFQLLSPLLSVESSQEVLPPQVLLEVLQCVCYNLLWSLCNSEETLTSREKAVAQRSQLSLFCERSHRCLSHSSSSIRQQAFLGVCDMLTAHSYQLHVRDANSHGPLLYTTNPKLQRALLTFLCTHVFIGVDGESHGKDGENSDMDRMADLHRRRNLLAAFCKLIIHGVLEMNIAAEVFMYYMKYCNDFGDIIKETLNKTRQLDKIESTRTLLLCLQELYVRLRREQESRGRAQPGIQTFTSIKELARRFALTFGDHVKFRECVAMIHRNGIEFVFQEFISTQDSPTPPNLTFLTILSEFSSKLLKQDKRTVLAYLQKHTAGHIINLREERWQPLVYYRASLLATAEGEDARSYVSSDRKLSAQHRSTYCKHKLEGSKLSLPFSRVDSKGSNSHQLSFSPSHQERTNDPSAISVPVDPPAERIRTGGSELGDTDESDDEIVEVDL